MARRRLPRLDPLMSKLPRRSCFISAGAEAAGAAGAAGAAAAAFAAPAVLLIMALARTFLAATAVAR